MSDIVKEKRKHVYDYDLFKQYLKEFDEMVNKYLLFCVEKNIKIPRNKNYWVNKDFSKFNCKSLKELNSFFQAVRFWRLTNSPPKYKNLGFRLYFFKSRDGKDYYNSIGGIELIITPKPQFVPDYNISTYRVGKPDVKPRDDRPDYSKNGNSFLTEKVYKKIK